MTSYTQRSKLSCGPDALAFAAGTLNPLITQAEVDKAWGIDDIKKFGNIGDTPLNHFAALERLKLNHSLIGSADICNGKGVNGQTVILIHDVPNDPDVRSIFTDLAKVWRQNFNEHWIVLESILRIGEAGYIKFHIGDGSVRKMRFDQFHRVFNAGFVRCAYVVGRGSRSIGFWARMKLRIAIAYSNFSGKFY